MAQPARSQRTLIFVSIAAIMLLAYPIHTVRSEEPAWAQFRGPGGLGIAPDNQAYPAELDVSRNLLWKTEVPRGHSSPCIWGDSIFVTARSGNSLETICIDRGNGDIKWRRSVEPEKFERISGSNSHAAPTPACDGERVYVYFGSFGLLAYSMEGSELWRKPLPIPSIWHGSASSPVLANDMVVLNCDSAGGAYILAVDQKTGETIWRQERQVHGQGWATPVLWKHGNEEELVVHGVGQVISYDLKDGRKRWWMDFLRSTMTGAALTPVYARETLFVAAAVGRGGDPVNPIELPDFKELLEMYDADGDNRLVEAEIPEDLSYIYRRGPEMTGVRGHFSQLDTDNDGALGKAEWNKVARDTRKISPTQMDSIFAVRAGGKDDVSQTHVKWTASEGVGQVSSPLFYQGRVYLVQHGGQVTCYDAETGRKKYGGRVGPRTYYFASPIAADDKVYFCSMNGVVIVVQAGDRLGILTENKIRERIYATPAPVDGKLYLRTDKNLYAFIKAKDESVQIQAGIAKKPTEPKAQEGPSAVVEADHSKTLYEAAAAGDIESVKSLIASGADVNTRNDWGWTPLYVATAMGNEDIVELLVARGADVDGPNQPGDTPLNLAVSNKHSEIVRLLIKHGADIRAGNEDGVTPLHTTAEHGDIEIATLLISGGADVNAVDKWVWTPLHYACWQNHADMVGLLISKGADVRKADEDGATPLHTASASGSIDIVGLLIDRGADISAKNGSGQTPLHLACRRGRKEVAELLLAKGVDFRAQDGGGRTAAGWARAMRRTKIFELIREFAAQAGGSTDIMSFYDYCALGDIDKVRSFVSEGVDINAGTKDGMVALHWAAMGGRDVAEYLVSAGADVDRKNDRGFTPLHFAAITGRVKVVELLIAKGADARARNSAGQTPLDLAKMRDRARVVELLRTHGVTE